MAPLPPLANHQRPDSLSPAQRMAQPTQALAATPKAQTAKPAHVPTPPDVRRLRERLVFALIDTSPTRVNAERAPQVIAEAERLTVYIMTGTVVPGGEGK